MKFAKDTSFAEKSKAKKALAAQEKEKIALHLKKKLELEAEERRRENEERKKLMEDGQLVHSTGSAKKSNAVKRTARSYAREEGAVDILLKKWLLDKRQSLRKKELNEGNKIEKSDCRKELKPKFKRN